ncbi:MAG: hypothetical protein K6G91_03080 [Kiritimatiellae bacterium]|nr:hypothetical protein [Kiritimatiellia bacterium]
MRIKNAVKAVLVFAALALVGFTANAGTEFLDQLLKVRDAAGTPIRTGVWHANLEQCRKYAEDNGIPLIAVWSNKGCAHCEKFEANSLSEPFAEWMKTSGYVYCFVYSDDADGRMNGAAYNWCWFGKKLKAYPFVRFYWKKDGKVLVDTASTGDQVDNSQGIQLGAKTNPDYGTYNKGGRFMISYIKPIFAGYQPDPTLGYKGGSFYFTNNTEHARLELADNTSNLLVKLVRVATDATSQKLKVTYPDGTTVEQNVAWNQGETSKTASIAINTAKYVENKTTKLELMNETKVASTVNVYNTTPENGYFNPWWLGEKDKDTLAAGEWTMDLDVAKARTKAQNGDAYTLVLLTGSMWCPWCIGIEEDLLDTDEFKRWAVGNNVSLVLLDIPKRSKNDNLRGTDEKIISTVPNGAAPTLLRDEIGIVNSVPKSGAGYLSRKMISAEDAEKTLQSAHNLGYYGGAFCNANSYRTGVPAVILLNKAGKIVGRLNYECGDKRENGKFPFNKEENMTRLNQLIDIANEKSEPNKYAKTTSLELSVGGETSATFYAAEGYKAFKLTNVPAGRATLKADYKDAELKLQKLVNVSLKRKDATGKVVKTEPVSMPEDVKTEKGSLECTFEAGASYALVVTVFEAETPVNYGTNNTKDVKISSTVILEPSEKRSTFTPTGSSVGMAVTAGSIYKFSGFADGALTSDFDAQNDGTYVAKSTKTATLAVTAGTEISYQLWNPGVIGFGTQQLSVYESKGAESFTVVRSEGSSGAASVTVYAKSEDAGAVGRYTIPSAVAVWKDGESGARKLEFKPIDNGLAESDATVVLAVEPTAGAECSASVDGSTLAVTIADSDVPTTEVSSYDASLFKGYNGEFAIPVDNVYGKATVNVTSGSLPAGVTIAWDAASKSVVVRGKPSAFSDKKSVTFTISDTRDGKTVTSVPVTVALQVVSAGEANKNLAVKSTSVIPMCATKGGKTYVAGLLTVTAVKSGRVSVKFQGTESGSTMFSGPWSKISADGTATFWASNKRTGASVTLTLSAAGICTAKLNKVGTYFGNGTLEGSAPVAKTGVYSAFAGCYTVTLPVAGDGKVESCGTGALTLEMANASAVKTGKVKVKGVSPNGVNVSMNAQLLLDPNDSTHASLTVFKRTTTEVLSAHMLICANARSICKDTTTLQVIRGADEVQSALVFRKRGASYLLDLEPYGGFFEKNSTPLDFVEDFPNDYASKKFRLVVDPARYEDSALYGAVRSVPGMELTATRTGFAISSKSGTINIRYSRTGGSFSGTAKVSFANKTVSCKYKGVVLPGWTECGDCGPVGNLVERPFASGTLWLTDRLDGQSVTRSMPVDIEYVP